MLTLQLVFDVGSMTNGFCFVKVLYDDNTFETNKL
jgi:hypothetical protein